MRIETSHPEPKPHRGVQNGAVVRRYHSLLQSLSSGAQKESLKLIESLALLAKEAPELWHHACAILPPARQKSFLQQIGKKSGLSEESVGFFDFVVVQKRLDILPLLSGFTTSLNAGTFACVSSDALSQGAQKKITDYLQKNAPPEHALSDQPSQKTKSLRSVTFRKEPRMLGGAKIFLNQTVIDLSLKTALNTFKKNVLNSYTKKRTV